MSVNKKRRDAFLSICIVLIFTGIIRYLFTLYFESYDSVRNNDTNAIVKIDSNSSPTRSGTKIILSISEDVLINTYTQTLNQGFDFKGELYRGKYDKDRPQDCVLLWDKPIFSQENYSVVDGDILDNHPKMHEGRVYYYVPFEYLYKGKKYVRISRVLISDFSKMISKSFKVWVNKENPKIAYLMWDEIDYDPTPPSWFNNN